MPESDKVFAGSVPENYDRYMVPLIFQSYADDMARRVAARSPKAVLETAAGSGVVTRAVAALLPDDATYVATDLNQPMLDHAKLRQGSDARVSWRQADALSLPFPDGSFDVVCCQFGAMFFPDRVKGYREARRVLKPSGGFIFNVWDRIEDNVIAADVTDAMAEFFPDDPPRFLARTPHGYHDTAQIRRDVLDAGFSGVTIATRTDQNRAISAQLAAISYCQGTPLRNEIEARRPDALEAATAHAAKVIAARHGEGEISAKIQAHVIEAIV
ncbi:class I SAM-dependent methyltransferase [Bradyrhizobium liaoningense]|uniref:class I SAM-dependent methyltransferase n=1 Tax=Bradyrhizobium liaoningense TaxID=43992 RepID=UPI001BAB73E5|nr:class I SAM-dependent methyltransferase [Bradyrhizobium liaoningense]MBR0712763.1 methyltransferase domain-containing protein [Bradyrhizobium liaoningense]